MQHQAPNYHETLFHNDPDLFPQLDLDELVEQSHVWAQNHQIVQRIILYRNACPPDPELFTPTYVLAVEIPDDEQARILVRLKEANPEAVREIREAFLELQKIEKEKEKERKRKGESPQNEKETRPFREVLLNDPNCRLEDGAIDILRKTEEISSSAWSEMANRFQPDSLCLAAGRSFSRVIKSGHLEWLKKNEIPFSHEWIIIICSPGEEPVEVLRDRFWVLYDKEQDITIPDSMIRAAEVANHQGTAQESITVLSFYKKGTHWRIGFLGKEEKFPDNKGFAYIHFLLQCPNTSFSGNQVYNLNYLPVTPAMSYYSGMTAEQLSECGLASEPPSFQPKIDIDAAKSVYKRRDGLRGELEVLEQRPDASELEKEKIQLEIDQLSQYLEDACRDFKKLGIGKRRAVRSKEEENARTRVTKAIKLAEEKIFADNPELKEYLHIQRAGGGFSYIQENLNRYTWQI